MRRDTRSACDGLFGRKGENTRKLDRRELLRVFGRLVAAGLVWAEGTRKAFLRAGGKGRLAASMNGARVFEGDFPEAVGGGRIKAPIELRAGENVIEFRIRCLPGPSQLSALLSRPENDRDTIEGIRYPA